MYEKSVKQYASLAQIHIFIDSVSQIIFFSVDTSTIACFFIICEKWHHICQKRYHYVDNVIRTRDMFISLNPTSLFQAILVLNVSAKIG